MFSCTYNMSTVTSKVGVLSRPCAGVISTCVSGLILKVNIECCFNTVILMQIQLNLEIPDNTSQGDKGINFP